MHGYHLKQSSRRIKIKLGVKGSVQQVDMFPCGRCSLCSEAGHNAVDCPELYKDLNHPSDPEPTGPRGQGEDDD